jgi:hypothetical protein
MTARVTLPTPDELRNKIEALRQDRGFLLPHHGAMAAAVPDLQEAYLRMYRALTLDERHLDLFEKEFIWMCILIAMKESVGTHHVDLFFKAGGTREQALAATRLTAVALGAPAFAFMSEEWPEHFPNLSGTAAFIDTLNATMEGSEIPGYLTALASAASCGSYGCRLPLGHCCQH